MKDWKTWVVAAIIVAAYWLGIFDGMDYIAFTRDSRDYRRMESKASDLGARVKALERIGIEIELKQRDGIWLVTHTEGK